MHAGRLAKGEVWIKHKTQAKQELNGHHQDGRLQEEGVESQIEPIEDERDETDGSVDASKEGQAIPQVKAEACYRRSSKHPGRLPIRTVLSCVAGNEDAYR